MFNKKDVMAGVLFYPVLLTTLKLSGVIGWSWWIVLAPLVSVFAIFNLAMILLVLLMFVGLACGAIAKLIDLYETRKAVTRRNKTLGKF